MAEARLTSVNTRPTQIDKCASGGGRRADDGAFADLGRPGVDISEPAFSNALCVVCGGFVAGPVVGLWSVCGRFVVGLWSAVPVCGRFVVDGIFRLRYTLTPSYQHAWW